MSDHIELLPYRPNWAEYVVENYEFKTDIITSQSGREQRRCLRRDPRMSVEVTLQPTSDDAAQLRRQLTLWGHYQFHLPDWVRRTALAQDVSAGVRVIPVSDPIDWLVAGDTVVLADDNQFVGTVEAISGNNVTLTEPVQFNVAAGTTLHRAWLGYLPSGMGVSWKTDKTAVASLTLNVLPGQVCPQGQGAAEASFMGVEVLELRPNWESGIDASHDYTVYDVDYGRGLMERTYPVSYVRPSVKWAMRNLSLERSQRVLQFFLRMRGRLRVCYIPSQLNDLPPKSASLAPSATSFTVEGVETYQFWDKAVQRAIRIETDDGDVLYRRVASITQSGNDSKVSLTTAVGASVTVKKVSWMVRSRLASDNLVLSWRTDTVSECDLTFTLLEDPDDE